MEIRVSHRKIVARYKYNYVHNAKSINEVLRILAMADTTRYQRKAKALGELADMVSQGISRIQQLVQQQPEPPPY